MVEWATKTLDNISFSLVRGPFGGSLKKEIFVSSGYKVYEQQDAIYGATAEGRYYISPDKYTELLRFAVADGDFIVSCSGTIGRIYRLPKNTPAGVINQALLKITIDEKQIDPDYFMQYFRWDEFQQSIIDDTQGGAIKNLVGMDKFKQTEIPLPPLPEQRRIAEALSDTDELITAMENLIAKKRAVKQGAMQELLTGKRRLPGFSGEWVEKPLLYCVNLLQGLTYSPYNVKSHGTLVLRSSNIINGKLTFSDCVYVDCVVDDVKYVKPNDILICVRNGSNALIGKSCVIDKSYNATFGAFMSVLRGDKTGYIANIISSDIVQNQIRNRSSATINQITKHDFEDIVVPIPSLAEQAAIASILSDMDSEIDALTTRLNKLRNIKQGMMSELLTGRIRLAEQEEKKTYEPIIEHEPPMLKVAEESVEYVKARKSSNAQN